MKIAPFHGSPQIWEEARDFVPERFDLQGPVPNETNTDFRCSPETSEAFADCDKRKKTLLDNLELLRLKLDNKARFIFYFLNGDIKNLMRNPEELLLELQEKGFTPFPNEAKKDKDYYGDYHYLLSATILELNMERVYELRFEKKKIENAMTKLSRK